MLFLEYLIKRIKRTVGLRHPLGSRMIIEGRYIFGKSTERVPNFGVKNVDILLLLVTKRGTISPEMRQRSLSLVEIPRIRFVFSARKAPVPYRSQARSRRERTRSEGAYLQESYVFRSECTRDYGH